jgi:hypothetical protein
MKTFLKSEGVQLVNGGYLSTMEGVPVSHEGFVKAQKHAEYILTFAELAKGKSFVAKEADSLDALKREVNKKLAAKKTMFVKSPKAPVKKLTQELADEAMSFMNFKKDSSKVDKINDFLQQFVVLAEFEEFGLFFDEDIVKLNRIYTMSEITKAVKAVIELLD